MSKAEGTERTLEEKILLSMARENLKNAPSASASAKALEDVNNEVESITKDFKVVDNIISKAAAYGACEFEEGFIQGYKTATRLFVAGLS